MNSRYVKGAKNKTTVMCSIELVRSLQVTKREEKKIKFLGTMFYKFLYSYKGWEVSIMWPKRRGFVIETQWKEKNYKDNTKKTVTTSHLYVYGYILGWLLPNPLLPLITSHRWEKVRDVDVGKCK